jgi:predicted RNA-binding protein Jag
MEEQVKKIKHYVQVLNDAMGIDISVEVKGTLGVIKEDGNIIFTTSGPQPAAIVEAYLMGFVTAITR